MDGGEMEDKTRMALQPVPDFFAMMRRDIVTDYVDRGDGRRYLCLKGAEEGDTLAVAFPAMALSIDVSSAGIKGGEQVQCSIPSILMLDAVGKPRLRWLREVEAWPWL